MSSAAPPVATSRTPPQTRAWRAAACSIAAAAAVTFTILAPQGWPTLLIDGTYAALALAAMIGWGSWPARWLSEEAGLLTRLPLAAGIGAGVLSTLVLALGLAGVLNQPSAAALSACGIVLGLWGARAPAAADSSTPAIEPTHADARWWGVCGVAAGAALGLALFLACIPPGVLWIAEGGGYDVLEYHLQGPREYWSQGRITFLSHNVYTSFPQLVEMHYLLLMHLAADPHAAAIPAQLLHAAMATLVVAALLAVVPCGAARPLALLLVGTSPWLVYLGCLAYVECGLLLMAVLAGGVALRASARPATMRDALLLGLLGGWAGACKYTGLVLVGAALAGAWLLAGMHVDWRARLRGAFLLGLGGAVAFGPWLIRNYAFTGNPIYPFAYERLGGAAWSAEQNAQWERGHQLKPEQSGPAGRAALALRELVGWPPGSAHFGLALPLCALVAALSANRRAALLCGLWCAALLVAWVALTHMPARFVVPLIAPLALLACGQLRSAIATRLCCGIALLGVGQHAWQVCTLVAREEARLARSAAQLSLIVGRSDALRDTHPLNLATPPDARIWLVGDAAVFYVARQMRYCVVFNRDPWLEFAKAESDAAAATAWLQRSGATHVHFSWREIERLRGTYGFPELVTPAWVARLVEAGLRPVRHEAIPDGELFEVPR